MCNALSHTKFRTLPSMANHLRIELVLDALEMAIGQRRPGNVIHHSDSNSALPVPGRLDSDRPRSVSFLGPVDRPGTPRGEALPHRCM